jgi:hypothetical protein
MIIAAIGIALVNGVNRSTPSFFRCLIKLSNSPLIAPFYSAQTLRRIRLLAQVFRSSRTHESQLSSRSHVQPWPKIAEVSIRMPGQNPENVTVAVALLGRAGGHQTRRNGRLLARFDFRDVSAN